MKTAVSIPDELFAAADATAERLGVSRSHLYQLALAEYLRRRGHEAITEALDRVYGSADDGSWLDPALVWLQGASLARDQDGQEW